MFGDSGFYARLVNALGGSPATAVPGDLGQISVNKSRIPIKYYHYFYQTVNNMSKI